MLTTSLLYGGMVLDHELMAPRNHSIEYTLMKICMMNFKYKHILILI